MRTFADREIDRTERSWTTPPRYSPARKTGPTIPSRSESATGASLVEQVVVINDFAVPEGGAGMLALMAVREYRRLGYRVTFVTGQSSTDELEALGATVVGLESDGLLKLSRSRAMVTGLANGDAEHLMSQWIARHDTPGTVYHLHNWSQILSPTIFRALRPVADRTIVTCHDFFNACPTGGFLHYGKSQPCQLRPMSARCLVSQCDRRNPIHKYWRTVRYLQLRRLARIGTAGWTFVLPHDRMRERFIDSGFPPETLVTIPNPAESWSASRIAAERNANFLFVGRVGPDKGADLAAEACRRAGVPLTIVGTGEQVTDLAARYPAVHFAGWCDRQQIVEHARRARALIVPSRVIEPFGLVICEAAMSGLPVLASARAYLSEDVEAGEFGRRFDVSQPAELARLLTAMAGNDQLVRTMSLNGQRKARNICHTPDGWVAGFLGLFDDKLRNTRWLQQSR